MAIAQSPISGPAGTTFTEWGAGLTPGGSATLHFEKPDGTEYPPRNVSLDAEGHFEIEYTAPYSKPSGMYEWWTIDDEAGLQWKQEYNSQPFSGFISQPRSG